MSRAVRFEVDGDGTVSEVVGAMTFTVHDVGGLRPYTMWAGRRMYLSAKHAAEARVAYAEYRSWVLSAGSDPRWDSE